MRSRCSSVLYMFGVLLTLTCAAQSQTLQVLHTFEGTDGKGPGALVIDSQGNIFGTAARGGIDNCSDFGCGNVFELSQSQSGWSFAILYGFQSETDGWNPGSPLTIGPGGSFYGATLDGGIEGGGGTVFRIAPICADPGCKRTIWTKATLYRFGQCDGAGVNGGLVLDGAGNLYGTTIAACSHRGDVYQLSPAQGLQNNWSKTVVHSFAGAPSDGSWILDTLLIDRSGDLYLPTFSGGSSNVGTICRLSPQGSSWQEDLLHTFTGLDVIHPINTLVSDSSGNLYGVTYGDQQPSIAFELTNLGGSWGFSQLHTFASGEAQALTSGLVMDAAGNFYGAGTGGAFGYGAVYKLTPSVNGWSYSTLYDFTGGSDGNDPQGPLVLDGKGHLFGTATSAGDVTCNLGTGCGTVWMITLNQ